MLNTAMDASQHMIDIFHSIKAIFGSKEITVDKTYKGRKTRPKNK